MKNVVLCCDGTANEFAQDKTNVIKLYSTLAQDSARQVVYYKPGIGTMEAAGALTNIGRKFTRLLGMSVSIPFSYSFDDGRWINPLVNVQRDRVHIKRRVLFLSRPHQLRIKVGIVVQFMTRFHRRDGGTVVIRLVCGCHGIGFRRHQSNGWVVDALFVAMLIPLNGTFCRPASPFFSRHLRKPPLL